MEEQRDKELEKFRDIQAKAARWHKAETLRNYIDKMEEKAIRSGSVSVELEHWLVWARAKADWYDPFVEQEDELLKDIDRETLAILKRSPTHYW